MMNLIQMPLWALPRHCPASIDSFCPAFDRIRPLRLVEKCYVVIGQQHPGDPSASGLRLRFFLHEALGRMST
jgi:hypothetical protein